MIDRGWRRSGDYVYQSAHPFAAEVELIGSPDMARTCCPQYTIRLDAEGFKPTKKHRQVVNRFNRYLTGDRAGAEPEKGHGKGKGKAKATEWDLMLELRRYEKGYGVSGERTYSVSRPRTGRTR